MSDADDLRTALARVLFNDDADVLMPNENLTVDDVLGVLGDPVLRLAVLNLIGDVEEAIYFDPPRFGPKQPALVEIGGAKSSHPTVAKFETFAFVVRPRGEATDC